VPIYARKEYLLLQSSYSHYRKVGVFLRPYYFLAVLLDHQKLGIQSLKISQPLNIGIIFGGFKVGPPKTNGLSEVVNFSYYHRAILSLHLPPPASSCRLLRRRPPRPGTPARRHRPVVPVRQPPHPGAPASHHHSAAPGRTPPQPLITERVTTLHGRPHR
jgi:hypothetical protein